MNDLRMQQYYMDKIKKNISQIKKSKNISLTQNVHEGNFSISENYPTNLIDGQQHKSNHTKDILFSGNGDHVRIGYDNDLRRKKQVPWEKPPIHTKYNVTGDTNFYENYVTDYNNELHTNDRLYQSHGYSNGQSGYVHENVIWDGKLKQYKTKVTSPSFLYTSNNIAVEKGNDIHGGIIDTHCFYNSCVNNAKLISQREGKKVGSNVSAPYGKSEPNNREKLHIVSNTLCRNKNNVHGLLDENICATSSFSFPNCVRNVSTTSSYERRGSSKSGIEQRGYDSYGHPHPSGHILRTNCSNHILGGSKRNYTGSLLNNVIMNRDHSGHSTARRGIFREASLGSCIRRDEIDRGVSKGGELKTTVCFLGGISNSDKRKHPKENNGESLKSVVHSGGGKIHFCFPRHEGVVKERLKNPIEVMYKERKVSSNQEHCSEMDRVHSIVTPQDRSDVLRHKEVSNHSSGDNGGNFQGVNSYRCLGGFFANKERQFVPNKKSISSTRLQEPHVFYPKKVSSLNGNAGIRNKQCGECRKEEGAIAPNGLRSGTLGGTPQKGASQNGEPQKGASRNGASKKEASQNGASRNSVLENNRYFISSFRAVDQGEIDGGNQQCMKEKDNHKMYSQEGKRNCLHFPLQGISICKSKRGYSQNETYEGGKVGKHKLDIIQSAPKQNAISHVEKGKDHFEAAESNSAPMSRNIPKGENSVDDTSFSTLGTNYGSEKRLNMKVMDNSTLTHLNCINKTDLVLGETKYGQAANHTTVLYKEANAKTVEKICNINGMGNLDRVIERSPLVEEGTKGEVPLNPPARGVHAEGVQKLERTCTDYEEGYYSRINRKDTYDEKVTNQKDTLLENSKYDEEAHVEENHEGTNERSNFNYIEDDSISREEKKKLEKELYLYFRKEGFLRPSSNSVLQDSEKGEKHERDQSGEPSEKGERNKAEETSKKGKMDKAEKTSEKNEPEENDSTPFLKGVRKNSGVHSSNRKSSITEYSQMDNYDISSSSVDIFDDKEIKEVFEEVTINRSIKSSFCVSRDEYEGARKESMDLGREYAEGEIQDSASAKGRRKKRRKRSLPSLEHLFCKKKNVLFMELLQSMKEKMEQRKEEWNNKEDALESKLNRVMLPTSEKERNLIDKIIYCLDPSYVNNTVDEADKWRQKLSYMRDKFLECILCVSYPTHLWNEETFETYLKSLNLNALFDDTFIKYEGDLNINLFHRDEELFSDVGNIGEGGFGVVTKMRFLSNPQYYAIKKISKEHIIKSQAAGQAYLEAKYHSVLSHVNIIKMYGCMQDNDFIYHVLEFCAKGSIYSISKNFKRRIIPDELAYKYFCHVVNGLYYLNQMGIFHRDIKMENVLVDHMDNAKLSDFGLSAMILGTRSHSALCGTLVYFSPEITSGSGYDWRSDIWSLGVLLYEMLVGDVPFDGTKTQIINSIFSCNLKFPDFVNPLAINLIKKALVVDVNKRLKLCDISSDPWMQEMWKLSFQKGLAGNTDSRYSRKDDSGDFNFIGSLIKAQCFLKSSLNASMSYPIGRGTVGKKNQEGEEHNEDVPTERENHNVDAFILETQQKLAEYLKIENFYMNEENVSSSDDMNSHQSEASFSSFSDSSRGTKQEVVVGRQQWSTSDVGEDSQGNRSAALQVEAQTDLSGTLQEGSRTTFLSGAPHEDLSLDSERDCSTESIPLEGITPGRIHSKQKSSCSYESIMQNGGSSNDDPCLKRHNWKTQSEQSNATEEAELVYSSESSGPTTNQYDHVPSAPCVERRRSKGESTREDIEGDVTPSGEPERDNIERDVTPSGESSKEDINGGVTPKKADDTLSENTIRGDPHEDGHLCDNSCMSNTSPFSNSPQSRDRFSSEVEEIVPNMVDIESLEKLLRRRVDNGRKCPRRVLPIYESKYTNGERSPVEKNSISIGRGEARKALLDDGKKNRGGENREEGHNPTTRRNIQPSQNSEKVTQVGNQRDEGKQRDSGNLPKVRKLLQVDEMYIPICVIKKKATESSGESNGAKINLQVKDTLVGGSNKSSLRTKQLSADGGREPHVVEAPSIELSDDKVECAKRSRIEKGEEKNSKTNNLCEDTRKGEVEEKGITKFKTTSKKKKTSEAEKREDTLINNKREEMLEKRSTDKLYKKDPFPRRSGVTDRKKNPLAMGKDKTDDKEPPAKENRRSPSYLCDLDGTSLYDKYIEKINQLYLSIKNKKYLNNGENRKSLFGQDDQTSAAMDSLEEEHEQEDIQNDKLVESNYLHDNNSSVEMKERSSTLVKGKNGSVDTQLDKQREERLEDNALNKMNPFHLRSYPVETGSSKLTASRQIGSAQMGSRRNVLKEEKNAYPRRHGERVLDEKSLDDKLANIEKDVSVTMCGKEKYRSSYTSRKLKSFLELKKEIMNDNVPNIRGRVTPDFFSPEGNAFNSSGTDGEEKSSSVGGVSGASGASSVRAGGSQNERGGHQAEENNPTWYYERQNAFSFSNSDYASDKFFYRRYKQNRTIHLDTSELGKREEGSFKVVKGRAMGACADEQGVQSATDAEFTQDDEFSEKALHAEQGETPTVITHPDGKTQYVLNHNGKYQRAKSTNMAVKKRNTQSGESARQISFNNKVTFMALQNDGAVGRTFSVQECSEEEEKQEKEKRKEQQKEQKKDQERKEQEKKSTQGGATILGWQKKGPKEISNLELISKIRQKNKINLLDKVKKDKCVSNVGKRRVERMVSSGSMNRSLSEVAVSSESVGKTSYTGRSDLLKKGSSNIGKLRDLSQNCKGSGNRVHSKSGVPHPSRRNNSIRNDSIEKKHSLEKEVMPKGSKGVRPTGTPAKRVESRSGSSMRSGVHKLDSINSIPSKSEENKKNMIQIAPRRLNSSSTVLSKSRENKSSSVEKRRKPYDDKTERRINKGVSPLRSGKTPCLKEVMTEEKTEGMGSCYLKKGGSSSRRNGSENFFSEKKDKSKEVIPNGCVQNDSKSRSQEETITVTNEESSDVPPTNSVQTTEEQVSLTQHRTKNGAYSMHNGKKMILGNNLKDARIKQYLKIKLQKIKKENEYASPLGGKTEGGHKEESLGQNSHTQGSHTRESLTQKSPAQQNLRQQTISHSPTNQYDSFEGYTNLSTSEGKKISFCTTNEVRRSISEIPFNCCVKRYFQSGSNGEIKTGRISPKESSPSSHFEEDPTWDRSNLSQSKKESVYPRVYSRVYSRCRSEAVGECNLTTGLDGDLLHIDRVRRERSNGEAEKERALLTDNRKEKHLKSGIMKGSSNVGNSTNVQLQPINDAAKRQKTTAQIYSHRDVNLKNVKSKIDTNIYRKEKNGTENVDLKYRSAAQTESNEWGEKGNPNRMLKGKQHMNTYQASSALSISPNERKRNSLIRNPALGVRNVATLERLNSGKSDAHCSNSRNKSSAKEREYPYQEEGGKPMKRFDSPLFDADYEQELQNKLLLLNKRSLCGAIDHQRENYGKDQVKSYSKKEGNHIIYEGATNSGMHGQSGHTLHRDCQNGIHLINGGSSEKDRSCNWGFSIPICASSSNGKSAMKGQLIRMKSNCRSDTPRSEANCLNDMGMSTSGWKKCNVLGSCPVEENGSNFLAEPEKRHYSMDVERAGKREVQGNYSDSFDDHERDVISGHSIKKNPVNKLSSIIFSSSVKECVEGSSSGKRKWGTPPKGVVTKTESLQMLRPPHGRSGSRVGNNYQTKEALKRNISCGDWPIMQFVNARGTDTESSDVADVDKALLCGRKRNEVANLKRSNINTDLYMKGQNKSSSRDATKGTQPVSTSKMQKSAQVYIAKRFNSGTPFLSRPSTSTSLHKGGEQIGTSAPQQVNGGIMNKNRNIVYGRKHTLAQKDSIKKNPSNSGSTKLFSSSDKWILTPEMGSTGIESSANCFAKKVVLDEDQSGWYTANCGKTAFFSKANTDATSRSREGLQAKSASNCVYMDGMRRNNTAQVLPSRVVNVADKNPTGCFLYKGYFPKQELKSAHGGSRHGGVKGTYERVEVNHSSVDTRQQRNGSAMSTKRMGSKTSLDIKPHTRVMAKGVM
ncbi:serine/threonine protein kinase [Plasmodium inui San Antonio 1]|uniref:Serine/threonine protein kinase n=1 Tax=Plasmodium inui San Antonio 1 TaxID=1237626 RepID=W7AT89_9APIC|nr:serine/threonine protein kinase [Plasmodium inui San Antonio 1]EUD68656.1 serine/threonine protein kinase [Plasmodium inui San Antonio 1]